MTRRWQSYTTGTLVGKTCDSVSQLANESSEQKALCAFSDVEALQICLATKAEASCHLHAMNTVPSRNGHKIHNLSYAPASKRLTGRRVLVPFLPSTITVIEG